MLTQEQIDLANSYLGITMGWGPIKSEKESDEPIPRLDADLGTAPHCQKQPASPSGFPAVPRGRAPNRQAR